MLHKMKTLEIYCVWYRDLTGKRTTGIPTTPNTNVILVNTLTRLYCITTFLWLSDVNNLYLRYSFIYIDWGFDVSFFLYFFNYLLCHHDCRLKYFRALYTTEFLFHNPHRNICLSTHLSNNNFFTIHYMFANDLCTSCSTCLLIYVVICKYIII